MIKNNCLFCGNDKGNRKMYCSTKCIKQSWYLKRHPNCYYSDNNKSFWKSETGLGFRWEKYIADLLGATHLEFNHKDQVTHRADILWGDKLIDVKSAQLNKRKNKRGKPVKKEQSGFWGFKPSHIKNDIDYVICVGVNEKSEAEKILLFPAREYPDNGITIGRKSKYDKYILAK